MREALAAYENGAGGEENEEGGSTGNEDPGESENATAAAGAAITGKEDNDDIVALAAEAEVQALAAEEILQEATKALSESRDFASTQLEEAIAKDLEARITAYDAKYGTMGLRKEWQRLLNHQRRTLQNVTRESSAIATALGVPDPSLTFLASSKRGGGGARARRLKSEVVAAANGPPAPHTVAGAETTAPSEAAVGNTTTGSNRNKGWLPVWSVKSGHAQTVLTEAGDGARKLLLQKEQPLQYALVERFTQHVRSGVQQVRCWLPFYDGISSGSGYKILCRCKVSLLSIL